MTQTQREWLASLDPPLAIPGARGRLSAAAHEALANARAKGIVFAEDIPAEPKEKRQRKRKPRKNLANPLPGADTNVSDESAGGTRDTPVSPFAPHRRNWTDAQYLMFAEPAGKTWCKTPCANCGYSVNNCSCGNTQVYDTFGRVKCDLLDVA